MYQNLPCLTEEHSHAKPSVSSYLSHHISRFLALEMKRAWTCWGRVLRHIQRPSAPFPYPNSLHWACQPRSSDLCMCKPTTGKYPSEHSKKRLGLEILGIASSAAPASKAPTITDLSVSLAMLRPKILGRYDLQTQNLAPLKPSSCSHPCEF